MRQVMRQVVRQVVRQVTLLDHTLLPFLLDVSGLLKLKLQCLNAQRYQKVGGFTLDFGPLHMCVCIHTHTHTHTLIGYIHCIICTCVLIF